MCDLTKSKTMSDIIHGTIVCSGIESEIIKTPIFNRLHRISQSSLAFLTFSSNRVKRFEHSIGTMNIAGKIFYNSICNASENNINLFMQKMYSEIRIWRDKTDYKDLKGGLDKKHYKEIKSAGAFPKCSFYYGSVPANIKKEYVYPYLVAFQSLRIAGLLHDVGHLPYSHILEKALNDLYKRVKASERIPESIKEEFINIMKDFVENQDEIHEEIGKLLISNIKEIINQGLTFQQRTDMEYFFFLLSFDFAKKILSSKYQDGDIFSDMHLIISGVVDADRMDYCSRDSYCAALNKDIFNYDRFLEGYTMIYKEIDEENTRFLFAPSIKNILMIEELVRKRYRIFADINYHHRVHKHEILLEKVICEIGLMELETMKEEKKHSQDELSDDELLEDEDFPIILPLEVSAIWSLVKEIKKQNSLLEYQLIQMDDSWLDTLLKHKFFKKYKTDYALNKTNGEDVLWNQFDELISTRKHYFSLIKRSNDFQLLDEKVFALFSKKTWHNEILQQRCNKISGKSYAEFRKGDRSFFFNEILNLMITLFDITLDEYYHFVEKSFNDMINTSCHLPIQHCIIRSSRFSNGLNTIKAPVFLVDNEGKATILEQLSFQRSAFLAEEKVTPAFHFYYLPKYDNDNISQCEVNIEDLINTLVNLLIEGFAQYDVNEKNTKK